MPYGAVLTEKNAEPWRILEHRKAISKFSYGYFRKKKILGYYSDIYYIC